MYNICKMVHKLFVTQSLAFDLLSHYNNMIYTIIINVFTLKQ